MAADAPSPTSRDGRDSPSDANATTTEPATDRGEPPHIANDKESQSPTSSTESGETDSTLARSPKVKASDPSKEDAPPLPDKQPPLPDEQPPAAAGTPVEDDGWDFQWDPTSQAYFFYNRFTGATTWENPRVSQDKAAADGSNATTTSAPGTTPASAAPTAPPPLPTSSAPAAGGYNPAIHGDYDPNAWYAKTGADEEAEEQEAAHLQAQRQLALQAAAAEGGGSDYGATASFNRFTGRFQAPGEGPERYGDEAKSKRQMNAFFDVDAAANAHDGRSLKAERSGKKLSKAELKQFKEKRKARKEEKRRAWLRD